MGKVKAYYQDLLTRYLTELEQDAYFDRLYAEWLESQQAYAFEDNYEPFETKSTTNDLTIVRRH